jgi:hypothetical protein
MLKLFVTLIVVVIAVIFLLARLKPGAFCVAEK